MANGNFIVQNGLQVGNLTISAATGDISTTGNVTVTGGGTVNVDYIGVSSIAKNDSSLSINDSGTGSTVVVALDGVTRSTTDANGIDLPSGERFSINGTSVLNATTLGTGVTASSLTSVGTLGSLGVTGAVTAGSFAGPLTGSTSGTHTGSVIGNASTATALATPRGINGINFDGTAPITVTAAADTLTGATLAAGVTASSLTSVGTLGSLTVTNTISAKDITLTGNLNVAGNVTTTSANSLTVTDPMIYLGEGNTGDIVDLGLIASYTSGTEKHAGVIRDATDGTFKFFDSVAAEPTTTVDFTSAVYSPVKMGALAATTGTFSGAVSASSFSGPITGAVTGNASTATTLQTARNINGVSFNGSADITVTAAAGTLTGATLAAGVTASSLTSVGTITSGTWSGAFGAVSGANLTSLTGANVTGTVASATSATTATTANALNTGNSYTVAGITTPSVTKSGTTGVGDIGQVANVFGTVYATNFNGLATTAKYADLAENYQADATYAAGTVVMFGGMEEVTLADADTKKVAGVVSTNPAHLMNGGLAGARVAAIALQGRVPCKVVGPVTKGDLMVSAGFGYAKADNNAAAGTIIGKALQAYGAGKGMIEVVVGRV